MTDRDDAKVVTVLEELPLQMGKDEMNLAEFPIARLGRSDTRKSIEYEGQIVDKTGSVLHQKWSVSGSQKYGLPTEYAERILVALMTITARAGFSDKKVPFSIYKVLQVLGQTRNTRNYKAVEKALRQLVGVTIYSEAAFFDKEKQKRVTNNKGFHIIEEYWLKSDGGDDQKAEEEESTAYIVWSQTLWDSFISGYIKNLDVGMYYSFESTLARRLFRFLDKRMHYQNSYQIDIFDLASRLGMKRYQYPSEVAKKLKPAFKELIARGYLESAEVIKVGKYRRVKFERVSRSAQQVSLFDIELEEESTPPFDVSDKDLYLEKVHNKYKTTRSEIELGEEIKKRLKYQKTSSRILDSFELLSLKDGTAIIGFNNNQLYIQGQRPNFTAQVKRILSILTKEDYEVEIVLEL